MLTMIDNNPAFNIAQFQLYKHGNICKSLRQNICVLTMITVFV